MDTIRSVHMGVREAGRLTDQQIAPRLEAYGDVCIARADAAGFPAGSGAEGMNFWQECMSSYMQLDVAISSFRESLEELEHVYEDVEAGRRGETDWRYWARRALVHGQSILRLCEALELDVPDEMSTQLGNLCTLIQCEE
jgi:hypothetical protein